MSMKFYAYTQQNVNGRYNSQLPRILIVRASDERSARSKAKTHVGIDLDETVTVTNSWYRSAQHRWDTQDWYDDDDDEFYHGSSVPRWDDYVLGQGKLSNLLSEDRRMTFMVVYSRDCVVKGKLE